MYSSSPKTFPIKRSYETGGSALRMQKYLLFGALHELYRWASLHRAAPPPFVLRPSSLRVEYYRRGTYSRDHVQCVDNSKCKQSGVATGDSDRAGTKERPCHNRTYAEEYYSVKARRNSSGHFTTENTRKPIYVPKPINVSPANRCSPSIKRGDIRFR